MQCSFTDTTRCPSTHMPQITCMLNNEVTQGVIETRERTIEIACWSAVVVIYHTSKIGDQKLVHHPLQEVRCRRGVGRRVDVLSLRLNTSSIKRFGPTYSMFILSGDLFGTGTVITCRFWWN